MKLKQLVRQRVQDFADEQGRLIFQNRQHFNTNDEFKSSRYGF